MGRLLSNGIVCIMCVAITVIAWGGIYTPDGARATGVYYIAPIGAAILAYRAYRAFRELRRSSDAAAGTRG